VYELTPEAKSGFKKEPLTPGPVQIPPEVPFKYWFKSTNVAEEQIFVGDVHEASEEFVKGILCVKISLQFPTVTEYVKLTDPDNPAGLKVLPETPCPDHVPPGVPETKVLKFIGLALAHIGWEIQAADNCVFIN
jgi:hypothetical protein